MSTLSRHQERQGRLNDSSVRSVKQWRYTAGASREGTGPGEVFDAQGNEMQQLSVY